MTLTLAHTYRSSDAVEGFWIQPKLDGVRAVFDGKKLTSRTGKQFHPPSWWVEDLARLQEEVGHPLDGELVCHMQISQWYDENFGHWCTIDSFNDVISTVRRKEADKRWDEIVLAVFDYVTDDTTPYRERYENLWCVEKSRSPSFLVPIEGTMEDGEAPMGEGWLAEAQVRGWEGVMLRNPAAPYERKRTRNLLKVKPVVDEEFIVLDVQAGTGKHEGRMGALVCERNGEAFKVGTGFTDVERECLDWVGKTITVEYFELTPRGVPRHPRFKGVRDYEWDSRSKSRVSAKL